MTLDVNSVTDSREGSNWVPWYWGLSHTAPTPKETCVCVSLKGSERGHGLPESLQLHLNENRKSWVRIADGLDKIKIPYKLTLIQPGLPGCYIEILWGFLLQFVDVQITIYVRSHPAANQSTEMKITQCFVYLLDCNTEILYKWKVCNYIMFGGGGGGEHDMARA
jgi:hypothetical protein